MMDPGVLFARYQELQRYVGWSDIDREEIQAVAPVLKTIFPELVADFYAEIESQPGARKVLVGGTAQVARLKDTLTAWLHELLSGEYDKGYVLRRWQVGRRHVEIGLDQVYTNVALSRLRVGLISALERSGHGTVAIRTIQSINRLLDLDLAIIEDAYQSEYRERERQTQQRELTREKERGELAFRQLVEAAGSMIVILREDGSIAYFNPFSEELTGCSANAAVGRNYFQLFVAADDRKAVEDAWMSVLSGSPIRRYECRLLLQDERPCWIVWNVQRLNDYGGHVAVLSIGQDITDHKHAEARLLQSERLAAMGKALTGLAHESRNALQRSQAGLEMLARRVDGQPEAVQLIGRIQHAQDDLHRLYEEVREYAAPVKFQFRLANLSDILHEEWEHLSVRPSQRSACLHEEFDGMNLKCEVDPFAIRHCFRNILENALTAGADLLEVYVKYTNARINGQPAVAVDIRDNGPGLTPEQQRCIFDEFFTTKTHGTGLGMAICKRFVEAHGGHVEAASPEDGGTVIRMTLPRKQK